MSDNIPRCPDCNSLADRPKCMFELGSECPRHAILQIWNQGKAAERQRVVALLEKQLELGDLLDSDAIGVLTELLVQVQA